MLRPYSFDFGDRRHIAFNCFCAMTGPAEDLHVICCVGATECEGDDVVDVPAFAGWDGDVQPPCYGPVIWRFSKIVSGAGGLIRRA